MKDSKNIYQFLNQVDFDIEDYNCEELNNIEKKRLKKTFKKSIRNKTSLKEFGIAAAILILTVGILLRTPFGRYVYAAAESKILEISYSIGRIFNIERDIKPYINMINEIKKDKGIEVKLSEVIVDNDRLVFNTILNTTEPVEGVSFENVDLFINGKKIPNKLGISQKTGFVDDTKTLFYSLCSYGINRIDQMEDIEIKLVLRDLRYYIGELKDTEGVKSGKWEFEFNANGKELVLKTKSLPIDYTFTIDNQVYSLEELEYNPLRQTIKGKREIIGEYEYPLRIELQGYDNLNNRIIFFIDSSSPEGVVFEYQKNYGFLREWSDEITSITLTPFAMDYPEGKQIGKEFTIFLNK